MDLDRLDTSGATTADILTFDGSDPSWDEVDWLSALTAYTVNATAADVAQVSCNAGDLLTGGGCYPDGSGYVRYSYPSGSNTWKCMGRNPGSSTIYNVTVYARCIDIP